MLPRIKPSFIIMYNTKFTNMSQIMYVKVQKFQQEPFWLPLRLVGNINISLIYINNGIMLVLLFLTEMAFLTEDQNT